MKTQVLGLPHSILKAFLIYHSQGSSENDIQKLYIPTYFSTLERNP
jgi:hypothetical protein